MEIEERGEVLRAALDELNTSIARGSDAWFPNFTSIRKPAEQVGYLARELHGDVKDLAEENERLRELRYQDSETARRAGVAATKRQARISALEKENAKLEGVKADLRRAEDKCDGLRIEKQHLEEDSRLMSADIRALRETEVILREKLRQVQLDYVSIRDSLRRLETHIGNLVDEASYGPLSPSEVQELADITENRMASQASRDLAGAAPSSDRGHFGPPKPRQNIAPGRPGGSKDVGSCEFTSRKVTVLDEKEQP